MGPRCARLVVAAIAIVFVSAGCAVSDDASARQDTTAGASTSIAPIPPPDPTDYPARAVAMPTGQQIADLPAEARAQVLCAAATSQQWQAILGEPPILRRLEDGSCGVYTTGLRARLAMTEAAIGNPRSPIAGRPATGEVKTATRDLVAGTELTVLLVDDLPTGLNFKPRLYLTMSPASGNHRVDSTESLAVRAAESVVPRLISPGPRLPGYQVFVPTPTTPGVGIFDLAVQVRTNRLCTVALDVLGPLPPHATIAPNDDYCIVGYTGGSPDEHSGRYDPWWSYTIMFDPQTAFTGVQSVSPGQLLPLDEGAYAARLTAAPGQPPLRISTSGANTPLPVPAREFAQRVVTTLLQP
ncbi:hypothetical protein [Nocardia wallacei]|uniref:DUF5642 domain-containing protein n=1 Tax=Nocardia wallacei TaxID=480035 RepID=A0A7G1KNA5_9NOCA|nr:hypothetical protein [Nocardia wallacei]BCK56668.1 hypothetical protein NWFMUON74_44400 [Nocardia wallacei]